MKKKIDIKQDESNALSEAHRAYLLARHGTLDLQPIPDMTDADPYNWPKHKVLSLHLLPQKPVPDSRPRKLQTSF